MCYYLLICKTKTKLNGRHNITGLIKETSKFNNSQQVLCNKQLNMNFKNLFMHSFIYQSFIFTKQQQN